MCRNEKRQALAIDLESVLVPEIWVEVARVSGVHALALTTRDIPDYGELMRRRAQICRAHGLTFDRLLPIVEKMQPLEGAVGFLQWAHAHAEVILISDTFRELAWPLVQKLGEWPLLCHRLKLDEDGYIDGRFDCPFLSKAERVRHLQQQGFCVTAVGDSFNDVPMFEVADASVLFNPASCLKDLIRTMPMAFTWNELKPQLKQLWKLPDNPNHHPLKKQSRKPVWCS